MYTKRQWLWGTFNFVPIITVELNNQIVKFSEGQLPVVADETPPCISHRVGLSLPLGWTWLWPLPTPLLLVFLRELPPDPSSGLHHHQQLHISHCELSAKFQNEAPLSQPTKSQRWRGMIQHILSLLSRCPLRISDSLPCVVVFVPPTKMCSSTASRTWSVWYGEVMGNVLNRKASCDMVL